MSNAGTAQRSHKPAHQLSKPLHGNCASIDPEVFFPDKLNTTTRIAKQICLDCPVRTQCLQEALDREEEFGIWGGLTAGERLRLAKGQPANRTRVVIPVLPDQHGYTGYRKGCTCTTCKKAWSAYTKERKEARRQPKPCAVCGNEIFGQGKSRYCTKDCRRIVDAARKHHGARTA